MLRLACPAVWSQDDVARCPCSFLCWCPLTLPFAAVFLPVRRFSVSISLHAPAITNPAVKRVRWSGYHHIQRCCFNAAALPAAAAARPSTCLPLSLLLDSRSFPFSPPPLPACGPRPCLLVSHTRHQYLRTLCNVDCVGQQVAVGRAEDAPCESTAAVAAGVRAAARPLVRWLVD